MSDRQIARNRFHKGLTANLRRYLRGFGVSFDEESAQFALGGIKAFDGVPHEALTEGVALSLGNRRDLMAQWETEHPDRNPYPPSFPERVIRQVDIALLECHEDGSPVLILARLRDMCVRELDTEPVSIAAPDEEL